MPKTLLLADDSPTIQRVVGLSFAGHDVTVVPVNDGDQAFEAINRTPPDIVLADVRMPGRSGYELADYMRQSARLATIPVLLLASPFEPVDRERMRAVGARGVLNKPIDPAAVVARVTDLLREGTPPASAASMAPAAPSPSPAGNAVAAVEPSPAPPSGRPPDDRSHLDDYFAEIDRAFVELKTTGRIPASSGADTAAADAPAERRVSVARPTVSLQDAFSALLAAETNDPAADPVSAPLPPIDMDALVEQVTARVLATMSDPLLREKITDIVFTTAERLVREEIERIKREIE